MFRRFFSAGPEPVDLSESPLLALQRKRAANGAELRAHLYAYDERSFIIASIMSVPGSAIVETGEPTVLAIDVNDADLGRAICAHLLAHEAREPGDLRGRNAADWGAFRASGDRAASGFEAKSWRTTIETAGQSLALDAAPVRSLHPEISVRAGAPPEHAPLGAGVRTALAAAKALRVAGFV